MVIYIIFVWVGMLILFLFTLRYERYERGEGIISLFEKIGRLLLKIPIFQKLYNQETERNLIVLQPITERKQRLEMYYSHKLGLLLLIFLVGSNFIFVSYLVRRQDSILVEDRQLIRSESESATDHVALLIEDSNEKHYVDYELKGRVHTKIEFEEEVARFEAQIEKYIVGDNESLDQVRQNINLKTNYDGFFFQVDWMSDDLYLIDSEGVVHNENVKIAQVVELTAQITYAEYENEIMVPVCVMPVLLTEQEQKEKRILDQIQASDERQKENERFLLPEEIDGEKVSYQLKEERQEGLYLFGLFMLIGLLFFAMDRDLKNQVEIRNQKLVEEYPEFISRFVLLLGAGMSVRNVLSMLSQEENQSIELQQELQILVRDLGNGVLEAEAIDAFGKRCKSAHYIKFCAYLIQNQKKGNRDLVSMLEQEARDAFLERKNDARRLGEEASTKLLLPMVGMLVIVMVIIILPAFMSLKI